MYVRDPWEYTVSFCFLTWALYCQYVSFLFQGMFNCILHWDGKMYVFLTAVLYADGVDKLQFAQSFSLIDISFFFF